MTWQQARFLKDPIPCGGTCCPETATHWFDLDEEEEIIFLCERCIACWIVERIWDDTQESGVVQA